MEEDTSLPDLPPVSNSHEKGGEKEGGGGGNKLTRHETTRSILLKDSVVGCIFIVLLSYRHDEFEVLQLSSLRNLPVYARRPERFINRNLWIRSVRGHLSEVKDEVVDAPKELILVDIPSSI